MQSVKIGSGKQVIAEFSTSSTHHVRVKKFSKKQIERLIKKGLLTSGGVEDVDVGVDVGVTGAGNLDKG